MDLTGFRWWTRKFVLLPIQHYFSPLHTKIIFQMPVKLQLHHHPTSSAAHKRLSLRFSQTFIKLNYMIFSCSRKDVEDWGMRSGEREAQHFFACCWRKEKSFLRPHRISDLECFSSFSTFFSPPTKRAHPSWVKVFVVFSIPHTQAMCVWMLIRNVFGTYEKRAFRDSPR